MKNFKESGYYQKKGNLYFDAKSRYGRKPDTIIFWYAITPKGRVSKWWETLRFNSERNVSTREKEMRIRDINHVILPKGYTWSEPFIYSGIL